MAVDMNKMVKLQDLDAFAEKADTKIKAVETKANAGFKEAKIINGNTLALYNTEDTTGEPAKTIDLPAEMVVDATKTTFVDNFSFTTTTYVGATDPNLNGKAVLVLAVKTIDKGVTTTSYSFINVDALVDDMSGKQDKDADATEGNAAKFDANGNAIDAGVAFSNILTTANIASEEDVNTVLGKYFTLEATGA